MSITNGRATKEFQDFFTSPQTAEEFAAHLIVDAGPDEPITVLEPAVGSGALIWPLLRSNRKFIVHCIDIQQDYLDYVAQTATDLGYKVVSTDFGLTISN